MGRNDHLDWWGCPFAVRHGPDRHQDSTRSQSQKKTLWRGPEENLGRPSPPRSQPRVFPREKVQRETKPAIKPSFHARASTERLHSVQRRNRHACEKKNAETVTLLEQDKTDGPRS